MRNIVASYLGMREPMRNRMGLLLSTLLLASCAMGPDYIRPHVETSEKFRMAQTEGQSIANLSWWELLHDNQLQQLIRLALAQNKDLKQAVASVEELEARLATARMDFLPKMDARSRVESNNPIPLCRRFLMPRWLVTMFLMMFPATGFRLAYLYFCAKAT